MHERNIVAILHTKGQAYGQHLKRRYARLDTAIPRCSELAILHGRPGDVIEIAHAITGMQLGTIKVKAGGKTVADWVWENKHA